MHVKLLSWACIPRFMAILMPTTSVGMAPDKSRNDSDTQLILDMKRMGSHQEKVPSAGRDLLFARSLEKVFEFRLG
jgi:hypothetical protein